MMLPVLSSAIGALTDPSTLINGLLIGGVYASMAIGFTMVWGVMGVINLAQGDLLMLGAFGSWAFIGGLTGAEAPSFGVFIVSLIAVAIVMAIVGYLLQRMLINRVMRTGKFLTLLLTFGVGLIIRQVALLYWGATPRSINPQLPGPNNYAFLGATIPTGRLFIFILALVFTVLFYVFLTRTRTGRAIRAASQNERAARMTGIDIDHIYSVTFGVSAAIVAVTGALVGVTLSFQPLMGNSYTITSFVVVVIGGLGSVGGALVGGVLLGLIEHVGSNIWSTGLSDAIGFTALVVFLLVRPYGLFGEEGDE